MPFQILLSVSSLMKPTQIELQRLKIKLKKRDLMMPIPLTQAFLKLNKNNSLPKNLMTSLLLNNKTPEKLSRRKKRSDLTPDLKFYKFLLNQ